MSRLLVPVLALLAAAAPAAAEPLKVYVLAGQSNMQGHAHLSTLDSMAGDPRTAPLLTRMRAADGTPRVCDRVWISSVGCLGDAYSDLREKAGRLTLGYGPGKDKFGPEFTFGLTLEKRHPGPILLIKTAWGGRNLHTEFRPPGAGPEKINDFTLEQWKKRGLDPAEETAKVHKNGGVFYRHMIDHVRAVLKDVKRVVPDYDDNEGYELAGFVWFQGFNDLVDGSAYPDRNKAGGYDEYAALLGHLIRDVRKDLGAPKLPVVIGVMGIGGDREGARPPQLHFRAAQIKVATLPEFKGTVKAVETSPFWDDDLDTLDQRWDRVNGKLEQEFKKGPALTGPQKEAARKKAAADHFTPEEWVRYKGGVSNGGYHYLGAARIMAPIGKAFADALVPPPGPAPKKAEMAGYLLVPHERVPQTYDAGFSMYVAAWPLLKDYPGSQFQSGLFGTWMFARNDGVPRKGHYSDIEGGLGWWRDTRFATETPKFIMGGVALEFSEWANGPGAGKGRNWAKPAGHYAVAQLSPWVIWPPDGLNLKQGTSGELFGYGYLPLPLTAAKKTTAGKDVPTGDQSWTLFLNTGNFKGPVAFFTPYFWSKPTLDKAEFAGTFLDARPSEPNKAIQMETQHVPAYVATDARGVSYARVAPTQFPVKADGDSPLVHRVSAYNRAALWDGVKAWFDGGPAVPGAIDPKAAGVHAFKGGGGATWQIYTPDTPKEKKAPVAWNSFATPAALDDTTFGYRWGKGVTKAGSLVTLPEYYRLEADAKGKDRWVVVSAKDVPAETGLADVAFPRRRDASPKPYVTPDEPASSWKTPGPAAGPFKAKLGDGSVATYYWYRFADQPALLNADLTAAEREALQKRVELLHRTWTKEREYLPPPTTGTLAHLDPAVLVTPPKGLEVGYVPIVTRQAAYE